MPREYMCAYGGCQSSDVRVSVNTGTERPKFCGELHAGLWLVRDGAMTASDPDIRKQLARQYDTLAAIVASIDSPKGEASV